jgi:hypothetical protein
MPITVKDAGQASALRRMIGNVTHLKRVGIGTALSEWQTEDMHRHRPFTMRSRAAGKATTKVRPHSLFEVNRSLYAQKGMVRVQKLLAKPRKRAYRGQFAIYQFYRARTSTRPYLRDSMFEALTVRLGELLQKELSWKA